MMLDLLDALVDIEVLDMLSFDVLVDVADHSVCEVEVDMCLVVLISCLL